jgi:membrane-associated protease RseP (regulator of RpoE activity)
MKANVGGIDRILRIVVGVLLVSQAFFGLNTPWGWVGLVPIITGTLRFCPFYPLLGISTCSCSTAQE